MVDPHRLRLLLSRLQSHLRELELYSGLGVEAYLADPQQIHASKYLLITAIEDALSMANHVIASEGLRAPSDYADAFRSLAEASLIERDLRDRLEKMARFRNLLVHVYAEVDDRRVHEFLRSDVADLDRCIEAILNAFPELESRGD